MRLGINKRSPAASSKFRKTKFGGEETGFSPLFSLFENGGETERVHFSPITMSQKKIFHFRISGI